MKRHQPPSIAQVSSIVRIAQFQTPEHELKKAINAAIPCLRIYFSLPAKLQSPRTEMAGLEITEFRPLQSKPFKNFGKASTFVAISSVETTRQRIAPSLAHLRELYIPRGSRGFGKPLESTLRRADATIIPGSKLRDLIVPSLLLF